MANLAIVGSHSTNGVAAIHSKLLRTTTVKDLAEMFPERFNNKTNGVTPRRWLLLANPALARTITEAIGDGWITDLGQLSKLKPLADDRGFRNDFRKAKREAKAQFADWLKTTSGQTVDPDTDLRLPDQAHPRIQAATAQRAAYRGALQPAAAESESRRCRRGHSSSRGKAAPAYHLAKVIIKFINNLARPSTATRRCAAESRSCFCPSTMCRSPNG